MKNNPLQYVPQRMMIDGKEWTIFRWIDKKGDDIQATKNPKTIGHPIDHRRYISFQ